MDEQMERSYLLSQLRTYKIISVIAIALAAFSFYSVISLQVNRIQTKLQLTEMKSSIETIKGDKVFTDEYRKAIMYTSTLVLLQYIEHVAESFVATDDFIVDKLHLLFDPDDGSFETLITVRMVSGKEAYYKGNGDFIFTDKELQEKGEDMVAQVKEYYKRARTSELPKWDDKKVSLSIEYFDIGDTESGKFKLADKKALAD
ncbi:hypothetical protein [Cohnella terricola]|uniref:Uncharacterized protein n=1 Tax=Cohnella terricola TaxID=1289167 RepID=A0A559JDN6_9BACL|nr:hypothetical protein [Cohnella terricola]TVX97980.1 hypothetical protein FPZ45_17195 [Cohnella terricola]